MSDAFGPTERRIFSHNPVILLASSVPLILAAPAALGHAPDLALRLLAVGLVAVFLVWRAKPWPWFRDVSVQADRRGLTLGERLVPPERIRKAVVVPAEKQKPARVRVELVGAAPSVEIAVEDVAEGRQILRALGRDVTQATASFSVGSGVVGNTTRLLGVGTAVVGSASLIAAVASLTGTIMGIVFAPLLAMFVLVALLALPTRLTVGADGLSLRWLFWKRFIDYADVTSVTRSEEPSAGGVTLMLGSGETVNIAVDGSQVGAVEERVSEALEAREGGGAAADASRLQRGDRPMATWITALRAMGAGADAGLREAPVPRDRLWRIVEDTRAEHGARAAAAVALGSTIAGGERARLHAAAESTAAASLRAALEAAAREDEETIREALEAVEEEATRKRA